VLFTNLRCQIGTSRCWGGRRHKIYAFTEQGEYLGYYSAHRMTNNGHVHIYEDRRSKGLPAQAHDRTLRPWDFSESDKGRGSTKPRLPLPGFRLGNPPPRLKNHFSR